MKKWDDLLINQDKLTKTERVKVFGSLSNYIFSKTKSVREKFTMEKLKEKKKISLIKTKILLGNIFRVKK